MAFLVKIFIAIFVAGLAQAKWKNIIQKATDIAGALGTKSSGSIDRGDGCDINWSYQGQLRGIKWKYYTVCIDKCTGLVETVVTEGRGGAAENCVQKLLKKIAREGEL